MTGAAVQLATGPRRAAPRMLYCIGSQKAGTTWLRRYFRGHPDIHVPFEREAHYFDARFGPSGGEIAARRTARFRRTARQRQVDWGVNAAFAPEHLAALVSAYEDRDPDHGAYLAVMRLGWDGQARYAADVTPLYATCGADGFAEMLRISPEARFVLILRDPRRRLLSHLAMRRDALLRKHGADAPGLAALVRSYLLGQEDGVQLNFDLCQTVEDLRAAVPQEQHRILFFETLFTDATMSALNAFLGIRNHPAEFDTVVRPTQKDRLPDRLDRRLRRHLAPQYARFAHLFPEGLPDSWDQAGPAGEVVG